MSLLKISQGKIYDPLNGIDGVIGDLWIRDGKIVSAESVAGEKPLRTIDATGLVVMPGGVDMHCHIAGSKVNAARKMRPEEKRTSAPIVAQGEFRSGTVGSVPSTFATGYLYAGLGYTTAFDAAIPPLSARHVHEEFQDTPIIDKGFYVMLGNNQYAMRQIAAGEDERLRNFMGWIIGATKAYGVKIVNPGAVELWKQTGGNIHSLDESVPYFNVSPRQILQGITRSVDALGIPHSAHIHCNNLGIPGNWQTTLATMEALEGARGHLTHIQFHSYGGDADDQSTFSSKVPELVDYVNRHPNLTVDVGQVIFGSTTSMTGDGPLGYFLQKVLGAKWYSADVEMEAGCGVSPIVYKNKSLVHALQWAIGLEWYLLMEDPWRIAMSTDHPNGGAFLAYPQIIALLMDRNRRDELLQALPAAVKNYCTLSDITREYSLFEIAIITRASPAKILGLQHKGHLGPNADGDVTLYQPDPDLQRMFELPRFLIRRGEVIVDDGELRSQSEGNVLHVAPSFDDGSLKHIEGWFNEHYSLQFSNFGIENDFLRSQIQVECQRV
ncbi:formylmethanofuran dehydrogenase subunit A [Planctomicrobium sp. SH668]|uniref:formylmethanofuran dehydrogenase subunit A n=1 Tax=Planctomicrobium sp. SH668 TaxID=3448126 RepID=UPI003F5C3B2E